jgi:hypothetical protein
MAIRYAGKETEIMLPEVESHTLGKPSRFQAKHGTPLVLHPIDRTFRTAARSLA